MIAKIFIFCLIIVAYFAIGFITVFFHSKIEDLSEHDPRVYATDPAKLTFVFWPVMWIVGICIVISYMITYFSNKARDLGSKNKYSKKL